MSRENKTAQQSSKDTEREMSPTQKSHPARPQADYQGEPEDAFMSPKAQQAAELGNEDYGLHKKSSQRLYSNRDAENTSLSQRSESKEVRRSLNSQSVNNLKDARNTDSFTNQSDKIQQSTLQPGHMKGPNAPFTSIDVFIKDTDPVNWRNVPVPLVDAMSHLVACMADIKKSIHSNYNENINTQRAVNLNKLAGRRSQEGTRKELEDEFIIRDIERDRLIEEKAKECRDRESQMESSLEKRLKDYVEEKTKNDQVQLKDWVKNVTNEQVQLAQRQQRGFFNKQLGEIKDMFNVDGVIGPFDTLMQSQGKSPNPFEFFKDWVTHIHQADLERQEFVKQMKDQMEEVSTNVQANQQALKKKMSEQDYDKNERKLIQKFDTKFMEMKEEMRMARNDYNSKLATLKADVSMMTFDKLTFNFLKDKVYNEWHGVVGKNKLSEGLIAALEQKQVRLTKKLNQCLEQLDLGSMSQLSSLSDDLGEGEGEHDQVKDSKASETSYKASKKTNKSKSRQSKSRSKNTGGAGSKTNKSNRPLSEKELAELSVQSPDSQQEKHTLPQQVTSPGNTAMSALIQARMDQLEKKVKVVSDLEEQVEQLQKELNQVKTLALSNNQRASEMSPSRSEGRRSIKNLSKKEKREIIKKRGKILDVKEVKKSTVSRSPSSPNQEDKMRNSLNQARAPLPIAWDVNQKKWMAHDQVTVETAFRQPRPMSGSSRATSPLSENLDGQLLHLESVQYKEYVEEYNRLAVERQVELRRIAARDSQNQSMPLNGETDLAINGEVMQQMPRSELNVMHPKFLRKDQPPQQSEGEERMQRYVYSNLVRPSLPGIVGEADLSRDIISGNYAYETNVQQRSFHLNNSTKPQSATNTNFHSKSGTINHHSLNIGQGKSLGLMNETGGSGSLVTAAERETNGDSSLAMIKSEVGQIREFAKQKHMLKGERKLFRPQTGTAQGRQRTMAAVHNNRGLKSITNLPPKGNSFVGNRGSSLQSFLPQQMIGSGGPTQVNVNRALNNNTEAKNNLVSHVNNFGFGRKSESSYEFAANKQSDYQGAAAGSALLNINAQRDSSSSTSRPLHVKFESLGGSSSHQKGSQILQ